MIRPVSYIEVLKAGAELFKEYAAECSIPEIGETDPRPEAYAALENSGFAKCFGAYDGDELVGFASVLAAVLPHYAKQVATIESLFVSKAHRASHAGRDLMAAVEAHAKETGCVAILYSAPAGGALERVLSHRKDYRHSNSVFVRNLR